MLDPRSEAIAFGPARMPTNLNQLANNITICKFQTIEINRLHYVLGELCCQQALPQCMDKVLVKIDNHTKRLFT